MKRFMKKKNNYYFYDLHTHTKASADAIGSIEDYIKLAKKRGLTGFAVTDHDRIYNGKEKIDEITIIPGTEITLKDSSHLLAYYIKKPLPKNKLTLEQAVKLIKKQGGYCFLAHPTNIKGGYFKSGGYLKIRRKKIEEIRNALNIVDGVEIGNAHETLQLRSLTKKIIVQAISGAQKLSAKKIIWTAGSDSHTPSSLGLGVIKTKEPLTKENFLKVIGEGNIIIKTKLNFARRILYLIEQLFVTIIKITFLYNNKIARKIFYKIFFHTYLKTKFFMSKIKKTFNLQE